MKKNDLYEEIMDNFSDLGCELGEMGEWSMCEQCEYKEVCIDYSIKIKSKKFK